LHTVHIFNAADAAAKHTPRLMFPADNPPSICKYLQEISFLNFNCLSEPFRNYYPPLRIKAPNCADHFLFQNHQSFTIYLAVYLAMSDIHILPYKQLKW